MLEKERLQLDVELVEAKRKAALTIVPSTSRAGENVFNVLASEEGEILIVVKMRARSMRLIKGEEATKWKTSIQHLAPM